MTAGNRVVVTLPAYQAETTLEKTVADLPAGVADELILVDDASADNTVQLARGLGISVYVHPHNRGYGGNQKTCYSKAIEHDAQIIVMLHPDYQYEPRSVPLLIAPILAGDADMTFGSRFAGLGNPREGGMPTYRYVGNRITTVIQNLILGSRFSEMHSGMRAYTRECLLSLPFLGYSEDFTFDAQFLVDAVTSGQRVVEVPIPTRYTKESSSIGIARSLKYIASGIAYASRMRSKRGKRGKRNPALSGPVPSRVRDEKAGVASIADLLRAGKRYVVTGRRAYVVDTGSSDRASLPEDWEIVTAEADIALLCGAPMREGDPSSLFRRAADCLKDEALLVFSPSGGEPKAIFSLVGETGFKVIEWSTSGASIVVARRLGTR